MEFMLSFDKTWDCVLQLQAGVAKWQTHRTLKMLAITYLSDQSRFCMFANPEFAGIGFSEAEAKERANPYRFDENHCNLILKNCCDTAGVLV
jgi:hypothetical protein